jgi:hypothetical protein
LLPFAFAARFARLLRICVIVSILEHEVGEARLCREGVLLRRVSSHVVPSAGGFFDSSQARSSQTHSLVISADWNAYEFSRETAVRMSKQSREACSKDRI